MKQECFTVLHPWAYDLDTVDFKYVISKDQVNQICKHAKSHITKVFWLTFFKSQTACSTDEFVNALREISEMSLSPSVFKQQEVLLQQFMIDSDFAICLKKEEDANKVELILNDFLQKCKINVLSQQIRLRQGGREPSDLVEEEALIDYKVENGPEFSFFKKH